MGNPNNKFVGKFNPLYVLCKGTEGACILNILVLATAMLIGDISFGYPSLLLLTLRDPLLNGFLKSRLDGSKWVLVDTPII